MSSLVVDASVAIKWYIPEVHSDAALRLQASSFDLFAPDLLHAESASILWKKVRRGDITADEARAILQDMLNLPIAIRSSDTLIMSALDIALDTQRSAYDSLYLALAVSLNVQMVTADSKLYQGLQSSSLQVHCLWIEDVA